MEIFGTVVSGTAVAIMVGEFAVLALLVAALVFAKMHRGKNHHWLMIFAFLFDMLLMKPVMYTRAFSGDFGSFPYEGTQILSHMLLSSVTVLAGLAAVFLGFKHRIRRDGNMFLPPGGKLHRVAGGAFIASWFAAYFTGLYIFLQIYL